MCFAWQEPNERGDGVSQTKDHSKLGIKQHLVESLGLQAHQNICVTLRRFPLRMKRNWLPNLVRK